MPPDPTATETLTLWASGGYNIGFAIFHLCFWMLFHWPASLRSSGPLNAAITQTLNIVLTYCFVVYGGALIWAGVVSTPVSPLVLIAGAGFWLLRTVLQSILFPMRNRMSVGITAVFAVGVAIHTLGAYLMAK